MSLYSALYLLHSPYCLSLHVPHVTTRESMDKFLRILTVWDFTEFLPPVPVSVNSNNVRFSLRTVCVFEHNWLNICMSEERFKLTQWTDMNILYAVQLQRLHRMGYGVDDTRMEILFAAGAGNLLFYTVSR